MDNLQRLEKTKLPQANPGFSRFLTVLETDVMKECNFRSKNVPCATPRRDSWLMDNLAGHCGTLAAVCRAGLMVVPGFAVAALAACARPDNATVSSAPGKVVYYACDAIPPVSWKRQVAIRYGADDQPVALSVDGLADNYLKKEMENSETIYINNAYAWKPDSAGGIMTDVANVLRFRCNVSGS